MATKKTKIYVHRYLLQSQHRLNAKSQTALHDGALIRVEVDGVSGYACLHPWEELGDSSLNELLKQLGDGNASQQARCALECAEVDRNARALGVSLFDGLHVPMSHATIVGGIRSVEDAVEAGFDRVKLKMGRDHLKNLNLITELYEAYPELRIRLDFNGVSDAGSMEQFLIGMDEEARRQIDFIEDPFPLGDKAWERLRDKFQIKLAVDRGVSEATAEYDISVIKPAINNVQKICEAALLAGRNMLVTSYMDHPVGQCYAAYCAGMLNANYPDLINNRCGLMTHELFEANAFTERMGKASPVWPSSFGCKESGLGFDDLFDGLDWEILN
jgi:o-succinylbenzoate synthase